MPKSYRIRTEIGQDKYINVKLEQDFDQLEILSLKINESDIYTRVCSDYGVVVGRVLVNGGFGVPNAKVSVFVPLTQEDETNPIISELYPYKNLSDLNEEGYRYNLLPKDPSYSVHAATGTFPTRQEVLLDQSYIEVYDKYYKFSVKTNDSGDFMIFGVPTGTQTLVMDVDLSDIGCFSLSPQDLIDAGVASPSQVNGNRFKSSSNLSELPQIKTLNRVVEVSPFWGDVDICQFGITRVDFDLTAEANIKIEPTAVFMGSIVSTTNEDAIKRNCKPKNDTGNMCDLIAGPGQILAIRQTIFTDNNGNPALEEFKFEEGGKLIDENGTWMINIPMNINYVITNEFGQQVISNDPKKGIPTKGKYRFKIKWQNEQGIQNDFLRGNFLVPNIKEHGWTSSGNDPFNPNSASQVTVTLPAGTVTGSTIPVVGTGGYLLEDTINSSNLTVIINGQPYFGDTTSIPVTAGDTIQFISNPIDDTQSQTFNITFLPQNYFEVLKSYAFSLDWDDYADKQSAIDCEDTFYEFNYNKVYTVSSFIDRYKNGKGRSRHLGIKEITNRACQSENNKFPVNDLQRNFDFIEFVVSILLFILKFPIIILISLAHFIAAIWPIFKWVIVIFIPLLLTYLIIQAASNVAGAVPFALGQLIGNLLAIVIYSAILAFFLIKIAPKIIAKKGFSKIALPMISYPDCDACPCEDRGSDFDEVESFASGTGEGNFSKLANISTSTNYQCGRDTANYNRNPYLNKLYEDECPTSVTLEATNSYNQIFSGVDDPAVSWRRGSRSFITRNEDCNRRRDEFGYPVTEPWPQKLNSFNLRDKYFDSASSSIGGINQITTSVNGSPNFKDQIVILLCDVGMTSEFQSGDLLTFQNPALSPDLIRLTGLTDSTGGTITNEFGTSSITGTTTTGTTISKTIWYANPNNPNNSLSTTIQIIQTGNTKTNYKFVSDIEYFQVVTGMTTQEFLNKSNLTRGSFPSEYLLHRIRYNYEQFDGNDDYTQSWSSLFTQCQQWDQLSILVLVRGVDPYTEKQNITYGLGRIFGYSNHNQVQVSGKFKLNYPIRGYSDGLKPIEHNTNDNSPSVSPTDRKNYYPSFTFTPDTMLFSQYTNTNSKLPYYYLSTDRNNSNLPGNYRPDLGLATNLNLNNLIVPTTNRLNQNLSFGGDFKVYNLMLPFRNSLSNPNNRQDDQLTDSTGPQNTAGNDLISPLESYYVGGGSFLISPRLRSDRFIGGDYDRSPVYWWLYSPGYHTYSTLPGVNFNNPQGIIMRSDRLPTSTNSEGSVGNPNTSFALHQNNSFAIYKIPNEGILSAPLSTTSTSPDSTGVSQDLDYSGAIGTSIVESLSCNGLVELKCYTGSGVNFGINQECSKDDKVKGGCYYLLNKPYISSIDDDIKLFLEWSARFRINFAACRGVFSHMFQNNWINGVLYMPTFNKGTIFNITGQVTNYEYCNDIIIFNDISNNFYYRSSPWDGTNFIGALPPAPTSALPGLLPAPQSDKSQNEKQILFPTTIMDLGNRDEFIAEICANPTFSGEYLINTIKSSTYNDNSDLLQLGIVSRLLNSTWAQQLLSVGDASVNQFFSREGDRIDGDFAQSFSINSEYEINPFISGNYPDNQIYLGEDTSGKPVFGIFYDLNEQQYKNRRAVSPGVSIYNISPLLQDYYGYQSTQEVPNYKWKLNSNTSIFGNETNNWYTTSPFYKKKYQQFDASSGDYFTTPTSTSPAINLGFITNFTPFYSFTGTLTPEPNGGTSTPFLVGGPNHFYFGLKNGKTALNRFIKTYLETEED
jgi:hypothetical protein